MSPFTILVHFLGLAAIFFAAEATVHAARRIDLVEGYQCYMDHQPVLWDALDAGFPNTTLQNPLTLGKLVSLFGSGLAAGRSICSVYQSIVPKPRDGLACHERFEDAGYPEMVKHRFSRADPFIQCLRLATQSGNPTLLLTQEEEKAMATNMRTRFLLEQQQST
jgi:hypothetical protein